MNDKMNDCIEILVIMAHYSLTHQKEDLLLNLACRGFLCLTLIIDAFSADPHLLESPVPLEKKQFLGSFLVFEQRTKQRQLNAQINNNSV